MLLSCLVDNIAGIASCLLKLRVADTNLGIVLRSLVTLVSCIIVSFLFFFFFLAFKLDPDESQLISRSPQANSMWYNSLTFSTIV